LEWASTLAAILIVHWVAVVVPGPNTLIVSTVAMKEARARGVAAAFGIATGALIWSVASMTGLALALQHAPILFRALQAIGGLYLIFVAYGLLRSTLGPPPDGGAQTAHATTGRHWVGAYRRGLATSLTNPKAAIYFLGIFSAGVSADTPTALRAIIVVACVASSLAWYTILAVLLSTGPAQRNYRRLQRPIDLTAGVIFGGFGLLMLFAVARAVA